MSSGVVGGDPLEIRPALQHTQTDAAEAAEPAEAVQPSQSMQDAAAVAPPHTGKCCMSLRVPGVCVPTHCMLKQLVLGNAGARSEFELGGLLLSHMQLHLLFVTL